METPFLDKSTIPDSFYGVLSASLDYAVNNLRKKQRQF